MYRTKYHSHKTLLDYCIYLEALALRPALDVFLLTTAITVTYKY